MGKKEAKGTRLHERQRPSRADGDRNAWKRWGAILKIVREHNGDPVKLDCLSRMVTDLTKEKPDRSVLIEDLKFLSPILSVQTGSVYPSRDFIDALEEVQVPVKAPVETYFKARRSTSRQAKRAVAIHIHRKILNRLDAVLLDAGSGCEAIAREMANGNKGHFTVITNNMRAIRAFMTNRSIRVHATGGYYMVEDESFIGARAKLALQNFHVKVLIVGVSGIAGSYVYCHGIEGEEELKKAIWVMPADVLVIPATLEKFAGRDACCFGELRKEIATAAGAREERSSLDWSAAEAVEKERQRGYAQAVDQVQVPGDFKPPRFTATRCEIVIEPEWMIKEDYRECLDKKGNLLAMIDAINQEEQISKVKVVMADVKRHELE